MIIFKKRNHKYMRDGVEIPSVSKILTTVFGGIGDFIKSDVMQKACNYGTAVHNEIELWEAKGQENLASIELEEWKKIRPKDWICYSCEKILDGVRFAGTYDMLFFDGKNYILLDIKTNTQYPKSHLERQLSLYKYAMKRERKFEIELKALWVNDKVCELRDVEYLGDEWVEKVLDCYFNDKKWINNTPQEFDNCYALRNITEIQDILKKLKDAENILEKFKSDLRDVMQKYDVDKFEFGDYVATYIKESVRETFDSKKFKEECPELFLKYKKDSKVSDSIRITERKV